MTYFFRLIGIIGLIFIIFGIGSKDRKKQNNLFFAGGILLVAYSAFLRDFVFIVLEIIFTIVAQYNLEKIKKDEHKN